MTSHQEPRDLPYHIRPAIPEDTEALAAVVVESTVTAFWGLVPEQCLTWLTKEESAENWRRWFRNQDGTTFLLVAQSVDGRVVGCALAGEQHKVSGIRAELFLMGVLPAFQKRGVGRQLVQAVLRRLSETGLGEVGVRVMSINPNCGFYEHMGAEFLREEPYDWNGVVLPQSVYRWHLESRRGNGPD